MGNSLDYGKHRARQGKQETEIKKGWAELLQSNLSIKIGKSKTPSQGLRRLRKNSRGQA